MMRLEQHLTALRAHGVLPQSLRVIGQNYGALLALVVLILFNLIFTRQFNSVIAITDLLVHVTPTLIIGVGMTLVIATGGIDISVGSVMGLTGILTYLIFSGKLFGIHNIVLGTAVAILIALAVATLIDTFNGVLVTRFKVQPIVATLISLDSAANPVTDGLGKELDAIAAVAVGGTPLTGGRATILGTTIGAIFIQLIRQIVVSLNVPDDIASIIIGILIVLAVFFQYQRKAA